MVKNCPLLITRHQNIADRLRSPALLDDPKNQTDSLPIQQKELDLNFPILIGDFTRAGGELSHNCYLGSSIDK